MRPIAPDLPTSVLCQGAQASGPGSSQGLSSHSRPTAAALQVHGHFIPARALQELSCGGRTLHSRPEKNPFLEAGLPGEHGRALYRARPSPGLRSVPRAI